MKIICLIYFKGQLSILFHSILFYGKAMYSSTLMICMLTFYCLHGSGHLNFAGKYLGIWIWRSNSASLNLQLILLRNYYRNVKINSQKCLCHCTISQPIRVLDCNFDVYSSVLCWTAFIESHHQNWSVATHGVLSLSDKVF